MTTYGQLRTSIQRTLARLAGQTCRASLPDDPTGHEETPLLYDTDLEEGSQPCKGKCWCCWETCDTAANPLIRVCTGCLDPDLQWIHQGCIDTFVSALPTPSVSRTASTPQAPGVLSRDFRCTRCNDPYKVSERAVPRILCLLRDKFLGTAMAVMVSCISVLTVCCMSLVWENWSSGNLLLDWEVVPGLSLQLSIVAFAFIMLVLCHAMNACTIWLMLDFVKGKYYRHVSGIVVDEDPDTDALPASDA
ncbi:hypothetical protein BC830DRAFT_1136368 [Chytriomyces sp. MP71]|nr:hypothetical protein BC830DRAFT_1136368 [Chytriomyces sp. MP71]